MKALPHHLLYTRGRIGQVAGQLLLRLMKRSVLKKSNKNGLKLEV